jgi:hypothetical protein
MFVVFALRLMDLVGSGIFSFPVNLYNTPVLYLGIQKTVIVASERHPRRVVFPKVHLIFFLT